MHASVTVAGCAAAAAMCSACSRASEPTPEQLAYIRTHPAHQPYTMFCAGCHGPQLQGGSASGFLDGEWRYGGSADQVRHSLLTGWPEDGMPGFEPAFTDEQADALVDYLRTVAAPPPVQAASFASATAPVAATMPAEPRDEITVRDYHLHFEVVVDKGLKTPWAIDFIDERRALVTEKSGRLRWLVDGQLDPKPIEGIPDVRDRGQGGLMDVAVDPDFGDGVNDWVYLAYTHPRQGGRLGMTKLVRGTIDGHRWTNEQVLFEARPEDYTSGRLHFGARIVFDAEGMLYFCIGERGIRDDAQRLDKPNGKIHRIHRDGSIPDDNPYAALSGEGPGSVYRSIYSYGHRNPQGMAIDHITGHLWLTEHGPRGGDELNISKPGLNYGWPIITYGINYNGTTITDAFERDGMQQPVLYWTPSIAVCGLDVYRDGPMPRWRGDLFAGGLAGEVVERLAIDGERVMHREVILKGRGRVRDVCCGPDGAIYVVHNGPDRIVRLRHAGPARER